MISEEKRAYNKAYYSSRREELKVNQRAYNLANREPIRLKSKERYHKDREINLLKKREYGKNNRAALRIRNKRNYDANRQTLVAYARRYRADFPDRVRNRNKKYNTSNPDKIRQWSQKRRALKKNATINLAGLKYFYASVRFKKQVSCYYCGDKTSGKLAHFDHIVPLSKGGQHSANNLCASCPTCNLSKHNVALSEWKRHAQGFLSL